ncbi:MAG: beta-ketoacyl-[acyl-carrier-protein] synthase family protein [Endomicrobium sp.]|nr:beta-ketoacyl-[acyl-carrier-protein] synthase family protein [Endomicrobium sp.]
MRLGITGIGIVSPLGVGKETNWKRLISSESQVCYNNIFDMYTASVEDFKIQDNLRQYKMAKTAISEALQEANIENIKRDEVGLCVGESKPNLFNKTLYFENSLLKKLKKTFQFHSETSSISAACATGILTIIKGCKLIETGLCNAIICGCAETSIHPLYVAGFKNMGVLTKHGPSPFDTNRDGFAIGEGACFVVVESIERALVRKAKIYCEIEGFANGIYSDKPLSISSHIKMKEIIKRAVNLQKPDYIHMHGTGTKLNDYNESKAVSEAFENAERISLSSTKAATGHTLGVSGMIGTAFSALAMQNNIVPPTLNFKQTNINLGLDYTPNTAKEKIINSTLTLSFGFGGQGSALFLKKHMSN